ncbi:squalene synthase HpnC [bacterium]|nr:squalene synthase HpnC [bacterium]
MGLRIGDCGWRIENIAAEHYENFPVLSRTLPRRLRPDVAAVYAFARAADDCADEIRGAEGAALLEGMRRRIETGTFDGDPIFEALGRTIRRHDLPARPFLDLIDAFLQDTRKNRYATFDEVLDYCRRSADPVGRLVLMLFGYRDAERFALSDRICTALQLINFWQDVAADLRDRDRVYIPAEDLRRFGVTESDLGTPRDREGYRRLMSYEIDRTEKILTAGFPLIRRLPFRLRFPVGMFAAGGWTILKRQRAVGLAGFRPTLRDWPSRWLLPVQFLRVLAFSA